MALNATEKVLLVAAAVLAMIGIGFLIGFRSGGKPIPESVASAPAAVQSDGSIIIRRDPGAKTESAPHIIPKGAKEERRMSVTVKPKGIAASACPPVTVDLSLIRQNNSRRVVASSRDGDILGAVDIPIETDLTGPESKKWAAGASYDPVNKKGGAWIERDISRVRVGLDVNQARTGGAEARVKLGWVF